MLSLLSACQTTPSSSGQTSSGASAPSAQLAGDAQALQRNVANLKGSLYQSSGDSAGDLARKSRLRATVNVLANEVSDLRRRIDAGATDSAALESELRGLQSQYQRIRTQLR
jgi:chromosome segregation ATPase